MCIWRIAENRYFTHILYVYTLKMSLYMSTRHMKHTRNANNKHQNYVVNELIFNY